MVRMSARRTPPNSVVLCAYFSDFQRLSNADGCALGSARGYRLGGRITTKYASRAGFQNSNVFFSRMAERRLRVGVLFGGRSGEHEVSLQSARAVMTALEQAGHEVVPIGVTRQGRWLVSGDPLRALASGDSV